MEMKYGGYIMAIKEDLMEIKDQLNSYIKHPYLMKHIDTPWINDDKLLVLYLMFKEHGKTSSINPYIHAIMLVQLALDIHDTIQIHNTSTHKEIKARQLTVLAGDYYSSLYYRILANENDANMTGILANAIKVINELKMTFYKDNDMSLEERLALLKEFESHLIVSIADTLGLAHWNHALKQFFYIKRLQREINNENNKQFSLLFDVFSDELMSKKKFQQIIETIIDETNRQLLIELKEHPFLLQHLYKEPLHIVSEA